MPSTVHRYTGNVLPPRWLSTTPVMAMAIKKINQCRQNGWMRIAVYDSDVLDYEQFTIKFKYNRQLYNRLCQLVAIWNENNAEAYATFTQNARVELSMKTTWWILAIRFRNKIFHLIEMAMVSIVSEMAEWWELLPLLLGLEPTTHADFRFGMIILQDTRPIVLLSWRYWATWMLVVRL